MKKSFPMEKEGLKPPRVVEAIKHEVRKYLKRERRKALPEGVDYWDFDCRVGAEEPVAKGVHVEEVVGAVDTAAKEGWEKVYVEILAKPGVRKGKGA